MKEIIFKCLNCNENFKGKNRDGVSCPECNGGHLVPLGYVKDLRDRAKEMLDIIDNAKKL